MKIPVVLATAAAICSAQSGIDHPRVATILDGGTLRPAFGVAASITLGTAEGDAPVSHACSRTRCIVKTETSIREGNFEVEAPPGPVLIDAGRESALVYFRETRAFARWKDGGLERIPVKIDGEALAIRWGTEAIDVAVRHGRAVRVERLHLPDGRAELLFATTEVIGAMLLLPGGALFASHGELVWRRDDGREQRWTQRVRALYRASDEYVQIDSGDAQLLLRVEPSRELLFAVPASATTDR